MIELTGEELNYLTWCATRALAPSLEENESSEADSGSVHGIEIKEATWKKQ